MHTLSPYTMMWHTIVCYDRIARGGAVGRKADYGVHMRRFGEAVAAARETLGISRRELARRCGVSARTLGRIEGGMAAVRGFGLRELCRLAAALRVSPECLLRDYEGAVAPGDCWWTHHDAPPERKKI